MKWHVKKKYAKGDKLTQLLLHSRGLVSEEDISVFLSPPPISTWFANLPDTFKESLKCARDLISSAMKAGEAIIIHGDYDADGISATAILYKALHDELGYGQAFYFIPNRFSHGYGLSKASIDSIKANYGSGLIVTVDCGITAVDEVEYAKQLGFKVIISDHHQKLTQLPAADCVVWLDEVVGASVSWFLSRAIGAKDSNTIALAGLATITDLQKVLGLNRTIVKKALDIFNSNPPIGIKKLVEVSGKNRPTLSTYDLGWIIGPRINASGRLVEAEDALKLLLSSDENEAYKLAWQLNTVNAQRQDLTTEMFDLISDLDEQNLPNVIISVSEKFHEGIIGLVASKIAQKYYRPAIIISMTDGLGKGSVRSIPGVNIIEMLREIDGDIFESLGGHPMAAGFSIAEVNLGEMKTRLVKKAEEVMHKDLFERSLEVDVQIPLELVTETTLEVVGGLEPFGLGNEEPIFCTRNLRIVSANQVGKDGAHLSLKFVDAEDSRTGLKYQKAIYFGHGSDAPLYRIGDTVDVAFTLSKNVYQGKTSVDMIIKDLVKV